MEVDYEVILQINLCQNAMEYNYLQLIWNVLLK